MKLALVVLSGSMACAVQVAVAVDSVVARVPVARSVRGIVLDTILGPQEDFEYVSRTAPRVTPPL